MTLKYQNSSGHLSLCDLQISLFIQSATACVQVQQLTQIATPLLNTFSQGYLAESGGTPGAAGPDGDA